MPVPPSNPSLEADPWLRKELILPWWKIVDVVGVMLGVGIILGAIYSTRHPSGAFYQRFSDYFFIKNTAFEAAFLALFLAYLRYRGWKPTDFRIRIGWSASAYGVGLFLLTTLGVYLINHLLFGLAQNFQDSAVGRWAALFLPGRPDVEPHSLPLHWWPLIGFTLLNAFYEELVYMGFVFNQWAAKNGAVKAVLFTSLIRLIVHSYQGVEHLFPIAMWSLLFGVWYCYQRKLWPLIFAHFLIDLLSLGIFKSIYGAPS